ncbi:hypothetical protein C8Q76DRAFT_694073 [Earliella scabrosa]|nr:hypothetical protein C8Q76DRAFT_694073 [Earliella scabrosa]
MLFAVMHVVSLLLALATTAHATPLALTSRDSISPPITSPSAGTVWRAGERQTVTWDLSGLEGVQPSNPLASIILGTFIDGKERLFFSSPIISGFPILDGNVTLVVPSVETGNDYIVCLFGSSGNISPPFTIIGSESSPVPSASTRIEAASSSNTLPPHQTGDSSSSVSLPPDVTRTDPGSSSASSTSSFVSFTLPSGILPSGASVTTAGETPTSPAPSPSPTDPAAAGAGADNSGSTVSVTHLQVWSVLVGGFVLRAML